MAFLFLCCKMIVFSIMIYSAHASECFDVAEIYLLTWHSEMLPRTHAHNATASLSSTAAVGIYNRSRASPERSGLGT